MSGPDGTIVIDPLRIVGLYTLVSGRVLLFLKSRDGDEHSVWVDEFDEDATYRGRHPFTIDVPDGVFSPRSFGVLWKDEADRFFISRTSEYGAPVLSVMRLERP